MGALISFLDDDGYRLLVADSCLHITDSSSMEMQRADKFEHSLFFMNQNADQTKTTITRSMIDATTHVAGVPKEVGSLPATSASFGNVHDWVIVPYVMSPFSIVVVVVLCVALLGGIGYYFVVYRRRRMTQSVI